MDTKKLGERIRMIRKHFGITQLQLAEAANMTQPAISRLENGEEVYASGLLAVLEIFRDKVDLDYLLDPNLDKENQVLLYYSRHEIRQKIETVLDDITQSLDESKKKIIALKSQL